MTDNSPIRKKPNLTTAPKIGYLFWCDFPADAQAPEFTKKRPVLIISKRSNLYGSVTVIPCTTKDQDGNKWAYKMDTSIDGKESWAICDKPTTLAVSRLVHPKNKLVKVSDVEFNNILSLLFEYLPQPR